MRHLILLSTVIVIMLAACKKKDDSSEPFHSVISSLQFPQDVPGDTISLSSFPMALGHSWTYAVYTDSVHSYDLTITVVADTMVNGYHVYKLTGGSAATGNRDLFLSDYIDEQFPSYYVQTASGLYYLDTLNLSALDSQSIAQSLLIFNYAPLPWSYMQHGGYNAEKYTQGYVKVNTPLQAFNCIKIDIGSRYASWGKNTNQYFSDKGLIMQTQEYEYSTKQGNSVTHYKNKKMMVLKSVNF